MNKDTNQELIDLFSIIHRTIRQRMSEYQGELSNLTMMQLQALVYVKREQRVIMSELARQFRVSGAAVTMLVDKLVESGFLVREKDERDRRVVYIALTPKANQKFEKLFTKKHEVVTQFLSVLNGEEREELLLILRKINKHLETNDAEGGSQ